jgi:hypothetical protein
MTSGVMVVPKRPRKVPNASSLWPWSKVAVTGASTPMVGLQTAPGQA